MCTAANVILVAEHLLEVLRERVLGNLLHLPLLLLCITPLSVGAMCPTTTTVPLTTAMNAELEQTNLLAVDPAVVTAQLDAEEKEELLQEKQLDQEQCLATYEVRKSPKRDKKRERWHAGLWGSCLMINCGSLMLSILSLSIVLGSRTQEEVFQMFGTRFLCGCHRCYKFNNEGNTCVKHKVAMLPGVFTTFGVLLFFVAIVATVWFKLEGKWPAVLTLVLGSVIVAIGLMLLIWSSQWQQKVWPREQCLCHPEILVGGEASTPAAASM